MNPSVHAGNDDTLFYFTAVLDPASELTQRWGSILLTLSRMDNVKVNIVLQPSIETSEIPIKRFYRYVTPSELDFDSNGQVD